MMLHTIRRDKALAAAAFSGLLLSLPFLCLGQDRDADATPGANILQPPRWPVMTGTDPEARRINPNPVPTTLEKLGRLPRPQELAGGSLMRYRTIRLGQAEKTLWSVEAYVVETQHDRDGDYHITLRSMTSGQKMACELPDPARMASPSPFAKQMTHARAELVASLHPTDKPQTCVVAVRITGLGYYGRVKPDEGLKNGLQLHPVVGIVFLK